MARALKHHVSLTNLLVLAGASVSVVCVIWAASSDQRSRAARRTHERVRTREEDADEAIEGSAADLHLDLALASDKSNAKRGERLAPAAEAFPGAVGCAEPPNRNWIIPKRERRRLLDSHELTCEI